MRILIMAAATALFAGPVLAAEVSLVSGFYRTEEREIADRDAGKETTMDVGGRFAEQLDPKLHWFAQGILSLKSYDKGDMAAAPDDSTSLNLGGGLRYYFAKMGDNIATFAYGIGQYKNEKDGRMTALGAENTEKNGLYYGASFGIRLYLGTDFFCDFETPLFNSALFATETTETETTTTTGTPPVTTKTKTEDETKKTELYVNTTGALQSVIVALGMRL